MQMRKDESGQFLLLSGVIISIGLVILLLYLNQSSIAGHSSADSIMGFPKNDIRNIRADTDNEVRFLASAENNNPYGSLNNTTRGPHRMQMYNDSFDLYASDLQMLMAEKGNVVSVDSKPALDGQKISNATVSIYYYNGETSYNEYYLVYFE